MQKINDFENGGQERSLLYYSHQLSRESGVMVFRFASERVQSSGLQENKDAFPAALSGRTHRHSSVLRAFRCC